MVEKAVPKILALETKMNLIGDSFAKEKDEEMEGVLSAVKGMKK